VPRPKKPRKKSGKQERHKKRQEEGKGPPLPLVETVKGNDQRGKAIRTVIIDGGTGGGKRKKFQDIKATTAVTAAERRGKNAPVGRKTRRIFWNGSGPEGVLEEMP